jgi:hypothetical protein
MDLKAALRLKSEDARQVDNRSAADKGGLQK